MLWEGPKEIPNLCRHNAILDIVLKYANITENAEVFKDQQLPAYSSDSLLRPDLVVIDHGRKGATNAIVACPFELSLPAMQRSLDANRTKNVAMQRNFKAKGYNVVLDALVLGSMGSVL